MADTFQKVREIFFSGPGIKVKYSTMHLIMPTIVIAILLALAIAILIQRAVKCKKTGTPFLNFKGYHFFAKGFNPFVFFTTIALMIAYFWVMPKIHFLAASIICLMALNCLYNRPFRKEDGKLIINGKSLCVSAAISVAGPLLIWVVFGVLFGLTLP